MLLVETGSVARGISPMLELGAPLFVEEETENHVSHPEENPRTGSSIDPGLLPKYHSEGTASMFIPRIFPHHKFIACVSFSCWLCNYDEANPREHRRFVLLIDVKSPWAFAYSKQLPHTLEVCVVFRVSYQMFIVPNSGINSQLNLWGVSMATRRTRAPSGGMESLATNGSGKTKKRQTVRSWKRCKSVWCWLSWL